MHASAAPLLARERACAERMRYGARKKKHSGALTDEVGWQQERREWAERRRDRAVSERAGPAAGLVAYWLGARRARAGAWPGSGLGNGGQLGRGKARASGPAGPRAGEVRVSVAKVSRPKVRYVSGPAWLFRFLFCFKFRFRFSLNLEFPTHTQT